MPALSIVDRIQYFALAPGPAAGSEAVGTVEELGHGTSGRLSEGQRVVSADWGNASWQQYVAVKEEFLVSATSRLRLSSCPCIF